MTMAAPTALSLSLAVEGAGAISALALEPAGARVAFVLAHGAGAGMTHPFMQRLAEGLAARGVATLRYQFPYMERGSKRTDPPPVAHAAVRAAVAEARRRWHRLPLVAGGKSFGARMTSQAQAAAPLPGVAGLVFIGFPLHPAGAPGTQRADHLAGVACPMLFLQGTRDELAEPALVRQVLARLGERAAVEWFEHADHAFHVRAGDVKQHGARNDDEVLAALLDAAAQWIHLRGAAAVPGPAA
ncbi:MAG: dienelactone hydrolase family protein [Rubrivivax sp.]|nr:dienelactone hydrolase family protein [Rubrivivax sp.]